MKRQTNYIDIELGQRIKYMRQQNNMTQADLGKIIGVSFQQIQKYEKAKNRVSVSMLHDLARALHTSPGYFIKNHTGDHEAEYISTLITSIPENMRPAIIDLVKKISGQQESANQ